jgi:hypothetical protein
VLPSACHTIRRTQQKGKKLLGVGARGRGGAGVHQAVVGGVLAPSAPCHRRARLVDVGAAAW